MPLRLRSELRLRVGPQHCEASLWAPGLKVRRTACARATGPGALAVDGAVEELLAAGHRLPRTASVCAEDEHLYYAVLPADGVWHDALHQARAHFSAMVGDTDLLVSTQLAPSGRQWLAVALAADRVEGWRQSLAGRDIGLGQVRAALFEDLWRLRADLPARSGLVVLVRSEGVMVVSLQAGAISDIAWERCEVTDRAVLRARVDAHGERLSQRAGAGSPLLPVLIVPADAAQQPWLTPLADVAGWRVVASATARDA